MKYLLILGLILLLILPVINTKVTAQDTPNGVDITPVGQTPAGPAQSTGSRKTSRSNNLCVKVGDPTNEKPAACNQGANQPLSFGPHPIAPPADGSLQIEIQRQFGISMLGFDEQHLQWAWEKFWEVSNTNFNSLVRGAIIQTTSVSDTHQAACPNPNSPAVYAGQFPEETAFKHILMHELGHVIRNCAGRIKAHETEFLNANAAEGGVSYYANNAPACTGSDKLSEDYAEMIAFYLNPGVPVASYLKCYQQAQNRYTNQDKPLHFEVARSVLGEF